MNWCLRGEDYGAGAVEAEAEVVSGVACLRSLIRVCCCDAQCEVDDSMKCKRSRKSFLLHWERRNGGGSIPEFL